MQGLARPAAVLALAVTLLAAGACDRSPGPPRRRRPGRKAIRPPTPKPAPAPVAKVKPRPVEKKREKPPAKEKPRKSPSGFEYGARDRLGAYRSLVETPDAGEIEALVRSRNTEALLADLPRTFFQICWAAASDDEATARYGLQLIEKALAKLHLVDQETGRPFTFKWERFNDVAYRAGWIGTNLANIKANPGLLQGGGD